MHDFLIVLCPCIPPGTLYLTYEKLCPGVKDCPLQKMIEETEEAGRQIEARLKAIDAAPSE